MRWVCWGRGRGSRDQELPHSTVPRTSTACDPMACMPCCPVDDAYCDRCDLLVGLPGLHVVGVERGPGGVQISVESAPTMMGCPACAVVASSHGRRVVRLVDTPCFRGPTVLWWRKRTWKCVEPSCPVGVFTEQDERVAKPRAMLTTRACRWVVDQLRYEHASIAGWPASWPRPGGPCGAASRRSSRLLLTMRLGSPM